jgi:hypothetical protein
VTSISSLSSGLAALTSLRDSARASGPVSPSPAIRPVAASAADMPHIGGASLTVKTSQNPDTLVQDTPALQRAAELVGAESSVPGKPTPAWLDSFSAYVRARYSAPVAYTDTGETVEFRVIQVHGNAKGQTGSGHDIVFVGGNGTVDTGAGDDFVYLATNGKAYLGNGNDHAYQAVNSTTYGQAGNDTFRLASNGRAFGGDGDDSFRLDANGTAFGDAGNDSIEIWGNGTGYGGAGDDYLRGIGGGRLNGGTGNDTIMAGGTYAYLNGGVGDDTLIMTGYGNVIYAHGDGNDTIRSLHAGGDFNRRTLAFGAGIRKEDVEITTTDQGVLITFGAKEGSILLEGYQKGRVAMTFANGDKLAIGTEADAKPAAAKPGVTPGTTVDVKT